MLCSVVQGRFQRFAARMESKQPGGPCEALEIQPGIVPEPAAAADRHGTVRRFVKNPGDDIKPRALANIPIAREHDAKQAAQRGLSPTCSFTPRLASFAWLSNFLVICARFPLQNQN
jgi:hypothetical protein